MADQNVVAALRLAKTLVEDLECRGPGDGHYSPNCDNGLHGALLKAEQIRDFLERTTR